MIERGNHWSLGILILSLVSLMLGTFVLGRRTYRSYVLLRSAYELGAPDVGSVRPWMTLQYVATAYHVIEPALAERLDLPAGTDPNATLGRIARERGITPLEYMQQVQDAITHLPRAPAHYLQEEEDAGLFEDEVLSALLVYGYPILGLTLMLGAIGVPLPSALSIVLAGSLTAQGQLSWGLSSVVAVIASVTGDLIGYILGRVIDRKIIERHARWLAFTRVRRVRVEQLFRKWGMLAVLLSRSLLSVLSSAVNLTAGASRFPLRGFCAPDHCGPCDLDFSLSGTGLRPWHRNRGRRRRSDEFGRITPFPGCTDRSNHGSVSRLGICSGY